MTALRRTHVGGPTLLLHGEDDQIVPNGFTARHQDQVNAELLQFLRSSPEPRPHDGRSVNHSLKRILP